MALRKMRKMSGRGDDTIAEYDVDVTTPDRMREIEEEFNRLVVAGYFAADITDKKDVLIKKFDSDADILMIPRVCGGC